MPARDGIAKLPAGFSVEIAGGEAIRASAVVIAVGLSCSEHIPSQLSGVPIELVSHSSAHRNLERFRGREVIVIGGGASAIDVAVLLHECGASARLISRREAVEVHDKMRLPRPLWDRAKRPLSTIGPGWKYVLCAPAAGVSSAAARPADVDRANLSRSGGRMVHEGAPFPRSASSCDCRILDAIIRKDGIEMRIDRDGKTERLAADHVIAATGFRTDVRRMGFLSAALRSRLDTAHHAPALSSQFESTVPGLYFVGPASANSFGPVMQFVAGAEFTAHRLAARLSGSASPRPRQQNSGTALFRRAAGSFAGRPAA